MASGNSSSSAKTHQRASRGPARTTHNSTVTLMLNDAKNYYKSLILRLKTKRSKEECQAELHRITEDMKKDVSTNIDALIQQVIEMRPQPGSPNYENTNRLYDSILDQVTQIMDDLERTFTGIFGELTANMDQLWQAISNNKEDQIHAAQENFRTILDIYNTQWNHAFDHANTTVHRFEKDLAKESMQQPPQYLK